MKAIFLPFVACLLMIVGCGDDPDHIPVCRNFRLKAIFKNSIGDVTGDAISGNVQFLKDSIKYEVVSSVVTVPVTSTIASHDVVNIFTTQPFDLSGISDNETILVIYHLNASVSDTLRMDISERSNFSLYNKNNPVDFTGGDCELSLYIYR